ncbi:unnamed protein product, partial [Larinioides sclopetarius]
MYNLTSRQHQEVIVFMILLGVLNINLEIWRILSGDFTPFLQAKKI